MFFWCYKETAPPQPQPQPRFLYGEKADYIAAMLLGVLTFSKPPHVLLLFPVVALAVIRRQRGRAAKTVAAWAIVTGILFGLNAAVTGEFNYQGGDRKTFYHTTGFPFANTWETFDNSGPVRGREDIMVGDVLVNSHSVNVFFHNLVYIFIGRYAGLVPYFFPGVLAALLFLFSRERRAAWQWLSLATIAAAIVMHLVVWPFTFNGGGGPIGNRYFLSFYAPFLFLTPAAFGLGSTAIALAGGALFTSAFVLNPFFSSVHAGDHTQTGLLRLLPIELTLIHDLPVAQNPDRFKRLLGGTPPVLAYFPDDGAYNPEGEWFWIKGKTRADVVLRAPVVPAGPGQFVSKAISRLAVEIRNAGVANTVTVSTGRESKTLEMQPGESQQVTLAVRSGVPFHRDVQPTSYLYDISISTTNGFVPFLDIPCETRDNCPASDSRYLGAMIHLIPEYTDAETTTWSSKGSE